MTIEEVAGTIRRKIKEYNEKYIIYKKLTFKEICSIYKINPQGIYMHLNGQHGGTFRKGTEDKIETLKKASITQIHKRRFG